jgi:hypothetical protein
VGTGTPSYKGFRYPVEIISHCVWLYYRFPLSLREVEEMMLARGVTVSHETIRKRTLLGVKCLFDQTAQVWSAVRWPRIAARPDGPGAPIEQLRASGTFQPRARPAGSRTPPLLGICSWTRPTTRTSSLSATKDRYRGRPATAIDRPSMARGPVHRGVPHGSAAGLPGSSPASLLDSGPDMSPRAARESGRRCGIDRHRQPARCGMMGRSRR